MRFWDTSALVPLLVREGRTAQQLQLLKEDRLIGVCWATASECYSALARLEREQRLGLDEFNMANELLQELESAWVVVNPTKALEDETKRLLRLHPIKCADAFQLGSAILLSEKNASSLEFISLDDRLRLAASKEGFRIRPLRS